MPRTVSGGEFVLAKIINECVNHKETSGDNNFGFSWTVDTQHKIYIGAFWIMEKKKLPYVKFCVSGIVLTTQVSTLTDPIHKP